MSFWFKIQKTKKRTGREISNSFLFPFPCWGLYYFWTNSLWVLASNVCSSRADLQGRLYQDQGDQYSQLLPTRLGARMREDPQIRAVVSKSLSPVVETRSIVFTWKVASKAASLSLSSYWGLRELFTLSGLFFFFIGGWRKLNCFEKGISKSRMSVFRAGSCAFCSALHLTWFSSPATSKASGFVLFSGQ